MGQEQAVLDHLFRWEQEGLPAVSGYVAGYLFQPASNLAQENAFGGIVEEAWIVVRHDQPYSRSLSALQRRDAALERVACIC